MRRVSRASIPPRVSVLVHKYGGTSVNGGRGTVAGTLLGVILLGMIGPALTFLGISAYWERAIRAKDRDLVKKETARVLKRVSETLGTPPRRVLRVEDLRQLVEEWAAAWVICLELLPGGWRLR